MHEKYNKKVICQDSIQNLESDIFQEATGLKGIPCAPPSNSSFSALWHPHTGHSRSPPFSQACLLLLTSGNMPSLTVGIIPGTTWLGWSRRSISCSVNGCEHCKDSSQIDFCQWELICWETKIPRLWMGITLVCLPKIRTEKFYLDISMTFHNILMMLKSEMWCLFSKVPFVSPRVTDTGPETDSPQPPQ